MVTKQLAISYMLLDIDRYQLSALKLMLVQQMDPNYSFTIIWYFPFVYIQLIIVSRYPLGPSMVNPSCMYTEYTYVFSVYYISHLWFSTVIANYMHDFDCQGDINQCPNKSNQVRFHNQFASFYQPYA